MGPELIHDCHGRRRCGHPYSGGRRYCQTGIVETVSREVRISPEVETIIGREYSAEIRRGPWPDDFTCAKCGGEGFISTGVPVSISVVAHPDGYRMSVLHVSCGQSAAYQSDEPAPPMGDHASLTPIVRGPDDEPRAACIFSMSTMMMGANQQGADRTGLLVAKLLEDGFHPCARKSVRGRSRRT